MGRYDPVYGNTLEETGYSGPIRSKTPKLKRLPYSRTLSEERPVEMGGEGLLGKVKNIVTWLIPGWFSSPQRARTLQSFDSRPSLSRSSIGYSTNATKDQRGGEACGGQQDGVPMGMEMETAVSSDDILREILTSEGVRDRSIIYSRLAQYFRLRKGSLLSREEFEKLSMLIQKQGITKRSFRRDQATTPRRAPSISVMSDMTDGDSHPEVTPRPTTVQAEKLSREFPKPLLRKSRVFSARFDEIDEAGLSFASQQSGSRSVLSAISACPNPVVSSDPDSANKDSAGKVSGQTGGAERANKPFEFVIPLATNGSTGTGIAEPPKPKLIFDFGPVGSDAKSSGTSAVRAVGAVEAPSLISFTESQTTKAEAPFKFALPTGEGSKDEGSTAKGKPSAFQFNLPPSEVSSGFSFNLLDAKQPASLATESALSLGGDKPASAIDSKGPPGFSFPALSSAGQPSFSFSKALEGPTPNTATSAEPDQSRETTARPSVKFEPSVSSPPQTSEKPLGFAFGATPPASEGVAGPDKEPSKPAGFAFGSLANKAESGNEIKSSAPFSFGSFPAAPSVKKENEVDSTAPKFSFGFTSTAPIAQPSVGVSNPTFSFGAGMNTTNSPLAVPGIMNEAAPSLLFNSMASPAKSPEPAPRGPFGSIPTFAASAGSSAPLSSLGKQVPITAGGGNGDGSANGNGNDDMMMETPAVKRPFGGGFSFGAGTSNGTLGSTFGSEPTFGKAPSGFNFGPQPAATTTSAGPGATTNSFEAPKAFGATGFGGFTFGGSTTQPTAFGNLPSPVASNITSALQMDSKAPMNFNFGGAETSSQSGPFTFGATPAGDGSAGGFSVGATAPATGRKFSVPKRRPK